MRRHDLVYLKPGAEIALGCFSPTLPVTSAAGVEARLAAWVEQGRPLVVARQRPPVVSIPPVSVPEETLAELPPMLPDHAKNLGNEAEAWLAGGVWLGLALPLTQARQRIACRVLPAAIERVTPPLALAAVLPRLAPVDADCLKALARSLGETGVTVRVYGSLAWEVLSGEGYRHAGSDMDLLCEVGAGVSVTGVARCLHLLQVADAAMQMRLDGELRFPNGLAVAWRELAAVWGQGLDGEARVLAKSCTQVALVPLAVLLAPVWTPGQEAVQGGGVGVDFAPLLVAAPAGLGGCARIPAHDRAEGGEAGHWADWEGLADAPYFSDFSDLSGAGL